MYVIDPSKCKKWVLRFQNNDSDEFCKNISEGVRTHLVLRQSLITTNEKKRSNCWNKREITYVTEKVPCTWVYWQEELHHIDAFSDVLFASQGALPQD